MHFLLSNAASKPNHWRDCRLLLQRCWGYHGPGSHGPRQWEKSGLTSLCWPETLDDLVGKRHSMKKKSVQKMGPVGGFWGVLNADVAQSSGGRVAGEHCTLYFLRHVVLARFKLVTHSTVQLNFYGFERWIWKKSTYEAKSINVVQRCCRLVSTSLITFITFPHLVFAVAVKLTPLQFTLLKGQRRSSQLPLLYTTKANFEAVSRKSESRGRYSALPGHGAEEMDRSVRLPPDSRA